MADLTITAAEVLKGSNASTRGGTAGEDIDVGEVVTLVGTAVYLADADHTTTNYQNASGIALNTALSGQPIDYDAADTALVLGTTAPPTPGLIYCLSRTAGKIMPVTDIQTTTTHKITVLGVGKADGGFYLKIINSQVAKTS